MSGLEHPIEPAPDPPPPTWHRWAKRGLQVLAAILGTPLLLVVLLSFAGNAAWWLDLLTHFRPQYAMALCLVAMLQLAVGPRWLGVAWLTGALLCAALIAPYYVPAANGAGAEVSIAHANVMGDKVDVEALARWVSGTEPDMLSLQEVTPRNLPRIVAALESAGLDYHVVVEAPRDDTRGVALLARQESISASIVEPTPDGDRPMIQASFEVQGVPVSMLGFHATRPAPGTNHAWQREGIDGAVLWSATHHLAGVQRVLIGDFNMTSQGSLAARLIRRGGVRDGRLGHGLVPTWPAGLPVFLRLPIDGVYLSEGLRATHVEAGPEIGSDHLPLLVRVAIRPGISGGAGPQFPPPAATSRGSSGESPREEAPAPGSAVNQGE